jgi:hypothetical protein
MRKADSTIQGFHISIIGVVSSISIHIFDFRISWSCFKVSISAFFAGHEIPIPSSTLGFGIMWKCTYRTVSTKVHISGRNQLDTSTYMVDNLMGKSSIVLQDIVVLGSASMN